jgi:hypothetical protein
LNEAPTDDVGKITFYAYAQTPLVPSLKKKKILITVVSEDDAEVLERKGMTFLRRARVLRFCQEARDQGTLLCYDDLVHLLSTSLSTLKRDIRRLRNDGFSPLLYRKKRRSRFGKADVGSRHT